MVEGEVRLLRELLVELESLRNRVPESVADGSLEEALLEVSNYVPSGDPLIAGVYRSLYRNLAVEARMLAQLAAAMRTRMERAGTPYITGVDYLRRRLDEFIERLGEYVMHLSSSARPRRV